jgi:hypothetical protein
MSKAASTPRPPVSSRIASTWPHRPGRSPHRSPRQASSHPATLRCSIAAATRPRTSRARPRRPLTPSPVVGHDERLDVWSVDAGGPRARHEPNLGRHADRCSIVAWSGSALQPSLAAALMSASQSADPQVAVPCGVRPRRDGGMVNRDMVSRLRPLLGVLAALAVVAIRAVRTSRRSIERWRRRLADVGDDWRSLLLGAPPAPA